MIYTVDVLHKNELIIPGIEVLADNPTDACQQVMNMSEYFYYKWNEELLLARNHSNITEWLQSMVDLQVKLIYGPLEYEGILRWDGHKRWMVRFHEFTSNEVSSYGYDQNDAAYIMLIQE
jgi:hypothetical protein